MLSIIVPLREMRMNPLDGESGSVGKAACAPEELRSLKTQVDSFDVLLCSLYLVKRTQRMCACVPCPYITACVCFSAEV